MNFFDIFQLTSLFLFLGIFIGRSVWLHKTGTKVFVTPNEKGGLNTLTKFVFIAILILWLYEIVKNAAHFSFTILPEAVSKIVLDSFVLNVLGTISIFSGLLVFILALVAFGKSWRIGLDKNNSGKLITSGIFSVTRNPFFIFINLFFIGTALIYTNIFFSGLSILAIIGIHFHILKEEKFLKSQYGEKYIIYKKQVKRYF